jgi:DNA-directed RNA polymerase specialized sigma24 family protein/CheY-like chemotaxis protein
MSSSRSVSQYLPYLRRYARALAGSQSSGDAYVAATLEALNREPQLLNVATNPRVALFGIFSAIWNSLPINIEEEPIVYGASVDRRLTQISSGPRQAFLLISLEGFSEVDAAEILRIDVAAFRKLVEDAGREMAAAIATGVLIIEDEMLIAMELEALVENLGHHSVGTARTHAQAIALAKVKRPGLILADIYLADGSSGQDAVNELLDSFEVPVIFITAYPERFLTGERPEQAFLVAKPFEPSTVSAVISQALFFERKAVRSLRRATAHQHLLVNHNDEPSPRQWAAVRTPGRMRDFRH